MSISIRLKHSATANKAPQPADLKDGELALNTNVASPAAYIKDSAGNIVKLAGAGAIGGTPATETAAGIAELATQAEVDTGTDDERIVTPLKLATAVPAASETDAGKVELATAAETTTGTDNTRAVHPAGLKVELDKKVDLAGDTMTGDLNLPNLVATGDVQSTSQNGGQLAGFRNHIINGDFRVWQRGTSVDVNPGVSGYTADRWKVSSGASTQAVARVSSTLPGFAYEANFNTALGSIFHGIELDRFGDAAPFTPGSTWTFSCWVRYRDISALNFVARFTGGAVGSGTDTTTVVSTPFGAAVETAPNSWNKHVVTFSIPDPLTFTASPTCLELILPGGTAAGGLIRYTGCQLEPGPVATPFEHRPIGTELALCQRYYQKLNLNGAGRYSGTSRAINIFGVPMRANPTARHPESVNGCRGLIDGGANKQETIPANSLACSAGSSTPGFLYAQFGGMPNNGTTTTTLPCGLFVPNIELDAEL